MHEHTIIALHEHSMPYVRLAMTSGPLPSCQCDIWFVRDSCLCGRDTTHALHCLRHRDGYIEHLALRELKQAQIVTQLISGPKHVFFS